MAVSDGEAVTVAEVLALPVLARGLPKVVAGQDRLDRPVRWVHVTEWANPTAALDGGDLITALSQSVTPAPGTALGREIAEAMELSKTYGGYVWSQWFQH
mgnify:CR=1 FL=1